MTWMQITLGVVAGLWLYDVTKWIVGWVHWYFTKNHRRREKLQQQQDLQKTMTRIFNELHQNAAQPEYDA